MMTRTEKRRAIVNLLIVVIGLGLCTFLIKQVWSSRTPQAPASPAQAVVKKEAQILAAPELNDILKRGKQNVTILDIQEREKFRKEHIPGAINIPADELDSRAEDELSKSDLIVIVDCACDGTNTASLVKHSTLVSLGFPNVAVLDEGLNAWRRASFEIVVAKD